MALPAHYAKSQGSTAGTMKRSARAAVLGLQLVVAGAAIFDVRDAGASSLAHPEPIIVSQADGRSFAVRHFGNAEGQWFETLDGFRVVRTDSGNWVYAVPAPASTENAAGHVVPSELLVGRDDPAAAGLVKPLRPVTLHAFADNPISSVVKAVSGSNPISSVRGDIPLLVILGYYDDALSAPNCTLCATTDPEVFRSTVFDESGNSVVHYFGEVSRGAVRLVPVTESHGAADDGIVGWLRLGAATPEGNVSSTSSYKSNRIAADAINAAMAYVDFTAYDANEDGRITSREVSLLIVVGAYEGSYGRDAEGASLTSDTTSPRFWGQSRSFVTSFSGVSVPRQSKDGTSVIIDTRTGGMTYSIIGERHGGHPATLGIMVHELGHSTFGLPDLYDIGGESNGVGVWSAMGYGSWGKRPTDSNPGDTPALLDAWSRVAMGWVTPVIPASGDTVTVDAAGGEGNTVYALPTERSNEYFLIENRQSSGYDEGLAYLLYTSDFGGLAIWHIDDNVGTAGLNNDNANEDHRRVDLIAAVGDAALDDASSYGRPTNLFYEGNRTSINDDTSPSTNLHSGEASGVAVSDVSFAAASMTFIGHYSMAAENTIFSTTNLGSGNELSINGDAAGDSGGGGGGAASVFAVTVVMLAGLRRRFAATLAASRFLR